MDHPLSHVYWIGGSPCAGKSTIADALSASFGLAVHRCDDAYVPHQALITPERQPVFSRLAAGTCDELWMRPVELQVAEELALYREEFPLVLDDVVRLAGTGPTIAEGAALLPELVAGLGVPDRRCVWIVPTEAFQRERYGRRDWRHDTLAACTDPDRAWRNWMDRDAGFARAVAAEARSLGRRVLTVDGSRSVADTVGDVASWFRLR